jgi:hypothetical protein
MKRNEDVYYGGSKSEFRFGNLMTATSKILAAIIALDSLLMAYGHAPLIRIISGPFPLAFPIGLYFLVSTIIFLLGAVFAGLGKLLKLTNYGLIAMSVIDELLLIYTREMPNALFGHMVPWSMGWFPLGTVQVFIGQLILIVLCAIRLKSK